MKKPKPIRRRRRAPSMHARMATFRERSASMRNMMIADAEAQIHAAEIYIADLRVYIMDIRRASDGVLGPPAVPPLTAAEEADIDRILRNLGRASRGDRQREKPEAPAQQPPSQQEAA